MRDFMATLSSQWDQGRFLCVGLDPVEELIPMSEAPLAFLAKIVTATAHVASCFKPNLQFFLGLGREGILILEHTIAHIRQVAPGVPVILDGKFGDIGKTNDATMKLVMSGKVDAVTLNPYVGPEGLDPFLRQKSLGCFVLCRTSNKGSDWMQKMKLQNGNCVYEQVAYDVMTGWNANGNCGLVVGATFPEELAKVRHIVGDMPILMPGIGTQGAEIEPTVNAGQDDRGRGMVINASSSISYASKEADYPKAAGAEAVRLHELITSFRKAA